MCRRRRRLSSGTSAATCPTKLFNIQFEPTQCTHTIFLQTHFLGIFAQSQNASAGTKSFSLHDWNHEIFLFVFLRFVTTVSALRDCVNVNDKRAIL